MELGIESVLGVEYFITKKMSFLAEYNLLIGYHWSKSNSELSDIMNEVPGDIINQDEIENRGFEIYSSAVKFGLSFYF